MSSNKVGSSRRTLFEQLMRTALEMWLFQTNLWRTVLQNLIERFYNRLCERKEIQRQNWPDPTDYENKSLKGELEKALLLIFWYPGYVELTLEHFMW